MGVLVLVMIGIESIPALAITLMEGGVALAVLALTGLAGGWLMRWLGLGGAPWLERLILGAGLAIGLLPLIMLGLGSAGLLTKTVASILVGVLAIAGLARLFLDLRELGIFVPTAARGAGILPASPVPPVPSPAVKGQTTSATSQTSTRGTLPASGAASDRPADLNPTLRWLWLVLCPFIAIMLLTACLPPGVLWREEGGGYDVLEYHLAVPKIFWEQGRITFLPNNVYSNFPLSSEMLSLLMMALRGNPIEASFMAVAVNTGLAALFIAAAWLAGRCFSPKAGLVAGILAGATPWVAYLAGVAYTEIGMLALGMCALAALLRIAARSDSPVGSPRAGWPTFSEGGFTIGVRELLTPSKHESEQEPRTRLPVSERWALLAGILAGLACGFKYTAVPLVAAPIAILLFVITRSPSGLLRSLLLYGLGALLAFSPWLIRNTINTGDPFFPLAYSVFGDRSGTWDEELNARWRKAHGSALAEQTEDAILTRAWQRTGGDFRVGAILLVLAGAGILRRRDRWTVALLLVLAWQLAVWMVATHLYARFATVILVPLIILGGRSAEDSRIRTAPPAITWIVIGLLIAGSTWNLYRLGKLYYDHTRIGGAALDAYGRTDWFTTGQWPGMEYVGAINKLPDQARVMLIGEARTVYIRRPCDYAVVFNRHPFAEAVDRIQAPAARLRWLQQRGTTHLLVHWGEIIRLTNTYGFWPALRPPGPYPGLIGAGLKEVKSFKYEDAEHPYAILYEVPRP